MSEHDQTYTDALEAARIFGSWHQTAPTEPQDPSLGIQVMLVDPPHAVRLHVVGDRAVRVDVFHHVNQEGKRQASETITGYNRSHHELAEKIEAIYQATLDRS